MDLTILVMKQHLFNSAEALLFDRQYAEAHWLYHDGSKQ